MLRNTNQSPPEETIDERGKLGGQNAQRLKRQKARSLNWQKQNG